MLTRAKTKCKNSNGGNPFEFRIRIRNTNHCYRPRQTLPSPPFDISNVERQNSAQLTCCWFSLCVRNRASMHCRVSMNAFRCAFSRGQWVNIPARFVLSNAIVVQPIWKWMGFQRQPQRHSTIATYLRPVHRCRIVYRKVNVSTR